jgi:hypothetical protein
MWDRLWLLWQRWAPFGEGPVSGLIWCCYEGVPPSDGYRVPRFHPRVLLTEFDGQMLQGAQNVRERLLARGEWARQAKARPASWTIQDLSKRHSLATRAPEGRWPPEDERQPACVVVKRSRRGISEIREFRDPPAALQGLREMGVEDA